ncbi:MAG: CDP-alcohol phosphatidyltransferase family protein [Candidatus Micrarchaeota archaeon]|nr:CDP-alcohol phosphatidyltransferase family protein [Candidatus Micrarchaeota archaeon]
MLKSRFPEFSNRASIRMGMLFSKIPLSANGWTVLSVVPAILGFVLLLYKQMDYALILFIISSVMDAIDGGVARVTGTVSNLGAYLDGMMDRVVEGLLFIGIMLYGIPDLVVGTYATPSYMWIALLLFFGSAMVSYSQAYATHRRVLRSEKRISKMPGILERAERLVLVFLGMLLYRFNPVYLTYAIALAAVLSMITMMQRVLFTIRNAEY